MRQLGDWNRVRQGDAHLETSRENKTNTVSIPGFGLNSPNHCSLKEEFDPTDF